MLLIDYWMYEEYHQNFPKIVILGNFGIFRPNGVGRLTLALLVLGCSKWYHCGQWWREYSSLIYLRTNSISDCVFQFLKVLIRIKGNKNTTFRNISMVHISQLPTFHKRHMTLTSPQTTAENINHMKMM